MFKGGTKHKSMRKTGRPKYKQIDREQGLFMAVVPDRLLDLNHPARLIWQLTASLDLSGFEAEIRS
jgi:hypothetical protein